MNVKTPVSLLQEYAVKNFQCIPQYGFAESDIPDANFKCTVLVEKLVASGYGSTKQSAKHQSAQRALEHYGIRLEYSDGNNNSSKPRPSLEPSKPQINYIGILNELASAKRRTYPVYEDIPSLYGSFRIICRFENWSTEGNGLQKKAAKQEAAQKMLQV